LARIVCLAGAWCEAMGRTRQHWPLGLVAPWWLAGQRVMYEVDVIRGLQPALPWTATREDFIENSPYACMSRSSHQPVEAPRARVELFDPVLRTELAWQLAELGWQVMHDAAAKVSAVFVQAEPASAVHHASLLERCRALAPARVIAVTTWPLPECCEQLRAAGVWAIVNPLMPADLREVLPASACGVASPSTQMQP
jgi:hypothetical protein